MNAGVLLFGVLSLGIGFAFNGPAMAAIVPDLVSERNFPLLSRLEVCS